MRCPGDQARVERRGQERQHEEREQDTVRERGTIVTQTAQGKSAGAQRSRGTPAAQNPASLSSPRTQALSFSKTARLLKPASDSASSSGLKAYDPATASL